MLAKKVLAYGITHLTDARYFAAWQVDYLCFPTGPNQGQDALTLDYIKAIREWVEGPTVALEFLGGFAGAGEDYLTAGFNHLLVSHDDDLPALRSAGYQLIAHVPVAGYQSGADLQELYEELLPHVKDVVFDFTAGGMRLEDVPPGAPAGTNLFYDVELGGSDPKALITGGIALRGSGEEKVGYKGFDEVEGIFEGLEEY